MSKHKIATVVQLLFFVLFTLIIAKGKTVLWLGIFVAGLVGALFFGRLYCGYVCPMNTLMRLSGWLRKKFGWETDKLPKILQSDKLSWIVFGLMIGTMVLSKRVLQRDVPIMVVLLAASFLFTLRYADWVFHNRVCPYGALLRITGKRAAHTTRVTPDLCIGCKKCEKVCPAEAIKVDKATRKALVDPSICLQCGACVQVCPKEAIHYS